MQVLNPGLYNLLLRRFKTVEVANAGLRASVSYVRKMGKLRCEVKEGERYKVCCPRCTDRRYRLWFSYLYHTYDKKTGQVLDHLMHCFNCEADFYDFYDLELLPLAARMRLTSVVEPVVHLDDAPKEMTLPTTTRSITQLTEQHEAIKYLKSRNFDPDVLAKLWNVGYASALDSNYQAQGRLILPVTTNGKIFGWQARALHGEMPKYQTARGMRRNSVIFNYDLAKTREVGVVCEGPLSAMRVGECGMALLGKSLSDAQTKLLGHGFGGKYLIIMTDPDAPGASADLKIISRLNNTVFKGVTSIRLQNGDPADHSFEDLWAIINHKLKSEFNLEPINPGVNPDLKKL